MEKDKYNVLFLCTGNSARSIMAEALLKHLGKGKYNVFSAGSKPKHKIHPMSLETLEKNNFNTEGLYSKSWDVFAKPNAPKIDIVITVCSNAANEACPIFPDTAMTTHWDIDDPARNLESEEKQQAEFFKTFLELEKRIKSLIVLLQEKHDKTTLQEQLKIMTDSK